MFLSIAFKLEIITKTLPMLVMLIILIVIPIEFSNPCGLAACNPCRLAILAIGLPLDILP